ncbi:MAG TPA: hypothetical protein VGN57_15260 [Pirellulaceae bacterium]|jgi:hypothetical protein|nr:hypothetical protein [Pirellulaceae bacterium]
MELVVLIGGALGVLLFLVATVLSFWSWRWFQPIAMALVLFATLPFLYYGAAVTKTRLAWLKVHDQFETNLAAAKQRVERLELGTDASGAKVNPTLAELETEIVGLSYDRGRVWSGSIPQGVALPTVRLQLTSAPAGPAAAADPLAAPADPAAPAPVAAAAAAPVVGTLPQNMIVYLFKEATTPQGWKLPYFYLGEWRVTESTGTSVTLETTGPLDGAQVRQLNEATDLNGQPATWAVFEMMPVDNRELLSDPEYMAGPIQQQFPLNEDALRRILPKALYGPTLTDQQYSETIAELSQQLTIDYLHDGESVAKIKETYPNFDPDPSTLYVNVKFLKEKTFEVDAEEGTNPVDRPAYNVEGQAVVPNLSQGPVIFKVGDTAVFPQALAQELAQSGDIQIDAAASAITYRRPLRDYGFLFSDTLFFLDQIEESIAQTQQKKIELQNALTSLAGDSDAGGTGGQIGLRNAERTRLQQDLAAVNKELEIVTARRNELQAKVAEKRALMSTLYRSNNQLVEELRRIQREQAERIESRTVSLPQGE